MPPPHPLPLQATIHRFYSVQLSIQSSFPTQFFHPCHPFPHPIYLLLLQTTRLISHPTNPLYLHHLAIDPTISSTLRFTLTHSTHRLRHPTNLATHPTHLDVQIGTKDFLGYLVIDQPISDLLAHLVILDQSLPLDELAVHVDLVL